MTCQSKMKKHRRINQCQKTKTIIFYHILRGIASNTKVFATKYRRKVFFEEKRHEIREILRQLCQWKGVEIIEGEVCPDHIHILVSIPPKMSVPKVYGISKREKCTNNISEMGEYEVCIPKPRILV